MAARDVACPGVNTGPMMSQLGFPGVVDCLSCDAAWAPSVARSNTGGGPEPMGGAYALWLLAGDESAATGRWEGAAEAFMRNAPAVGVAIDDDYMPDVAEEVPLGEPDYYRTPVAAPWTASDHWSNRLRAAEDMHRELKRCAYDRYEAAKEAAGGELPAAAPWGVPVPSFEFRTHPLYGPDARPPVPLEGLPKYAGLSVSPIAVSAEEAMPKLR